jgi:cytochrome c biogenesis protein
MKKLIRFFSSVKLAIVLIILLVAASIVGTLIPQGRDMAEYEARYGRMGASLVRFQLTDVYRSVWFLGLLGFFGLNVVACTLTRLGGKVRRAKRPRVESDPKELEGYKIRARFRAGGGEADGHGTEEIKTRAIKALKSARYRVRTAGNHLHGRKRIDGIFGSDIVHLGLLVIIAGGMATWLAGFRADLDLSPGQTREVPRADFSVRLDRFDTEMYPGGGVKDWKSTVTVIEEGRDTRTQVVEVNHPLVHKGFSLYQMAYGINWEEATLVLRIGKRNISSGEAAGQSAGGGAAADAARQTIRIKRGEIVSLGDEAGTEILVRQFIPDFVLGENNRPESRSLEPNNPAAYVEMRQEGKTVVEGWIFAMYPEVTRLRGEGAAGTIIELYDLDAPEYSVLQAAKDPGVPLIWLGSLLIMAGLILAFYRPTWEIRMVVEAGNAVMAGGIAAKSRDRFEKEFTRVMDELRKTRARSAE